MREILAITEMKGRLKTGQNRELQERLKSIDAALQRGVLADRGENRFRRARTAEKAAKYALG